MANRKGRKRLSIDIPIELHAFLSRTCKKRNITLTRYVIRVLTRHSLEEKR